MATNLPSCFLIQFLEQLLKFLVLWPRRTNTVHLPLYLVHVPNFGGCQGRRTGMAVTTVSISLILGGWVTKVLKNGDKSRGLEGWVTTIF